MEEAKIRFLFGSVPVGSDPDDPDDRERLLARIEGRDLSPTRWALRLVVATQIANSDPPETWSKAQELLDAGLDRANVLRQLVMVLAIQLRGMLDRKQTFDRDLYVSQLEALPLPTAEEAAAALIGVVREHQGIDVEDAERLALAGLGRTGDELTGQLLDEVSDHLVDADGPLSWLPGDRSVHVLDLTSGSVFTHRLSDLELDLGALDVEFDLAGFERYDDLRLGDGTPIEIESGVRRTLWFGPDGWLEPFRDAPIVAVRVEADSDRGGGVLSVGALGSEPVLDDKLVQRVREVYDDAVDEAGLPASAEEIVLGLLLEDRGSFGEPRPPLAELCEAAGLERRGHEMAHGEEIWVNDAQRSRTMRILALLDDTTEARAALDALDAAEDSDLDVGGLRRVLAGLREQAVLNVVADELLGFDDDAEALRHGETFGRRLLAAARRPEEVAVARWWTAVIAERMGDVRTADAHLALAVQADPAWEPVVDRAAWYLSDKGDAVGAARLWERLGVDGDINVDLAMVKRFTQPAGPKLGRNQPCWCGSGRKYKVCHLGHPQLPPLAERVGWLCRKAVAYLERRGGAPHDEVMSLAEARAVDPDDADSVSDALRDSLVADVALTEGGWWDRFVADRGALLPDDEALLATAWALVPRTVFEVLETRPGHGLTLRDLGTGDRVEVRERSFSPEATVGQVICARAVPEGEGETHQLVGGIFAVIPGTEAEVLELCDEGAGHELCDYVARQYRPPQLTTREGEPLVQCDLAVTVPDPAFARRFLDHNYEPQDRGWHELHSISEEEEILRARLELKGDQLTVITHSEARMDRVLASLQAGISDLRVISDQRTPLRAGDMPALVSPPDAADPGRSDSLPEGIIRQVQEQQERRWIGEHIPALSGLTPVEAAADPSRREQLERLLASFPDPSVLPPGAITMRPDRLRELLGL